MPSPLKFDVAISTFEKESDLILTAAEDDTYGPAIAPRLDDGVVASGRSLWKQLFQPADDEQQPPATPEPPPAGSNAAQAQSHGAVGTLTNQQRALLAAYKPHAQKAREAARKAFKGDDVKLHDEFRVGVEPSKVVAKIVSEGRLLLTAVRNPANTAALKSKGAYISSDADAFATALDALAKSETDQEIAKGAAKGSTDARNANLNTLYDTVTTIQAAAKNQFPGDRQALTTFRIGLFPPKERGSGNNPQASPPTTPTPPSPK